MAITPLPALDRTSATFKTDVDTFFGAKLPTFSAEVEAARSDVVTKQGQAATSATNAATSEGNALASKNAAATSATNAATSEGNALASKNAAQTIATTFGNVQGAVDAATVQAGNSSTSAGASETSRLASGVSAGLAATAKTGAEAARDAANAVGKVFTSTALGIAGTTSGQSFSVLSVDLLDLIVYTNAAGTATELTRFKTKAFMDSLFNTAGYGRSGYAWGIADATNALAIGVRPSGAVDIGTLLDVAGKINANIAAITSIGDVSLARDTFSAYASRSGVSWGVVDANNRLALWLDLAGQLHIPQGNVSSLLSAGYQAQLDAAIARITGIDAILESIASLYSDGDSLTEGAGTSNSSLYSYLARLAALYVAAGAPRTVTNSGIGGQTSSQIAARAGAITTLVTLSGNSIPASGAVAASTVSTNLLYTPATNVARSIGGSIGGIPGTLTKDTSEAYSFTRTAAGSVTPITAETPFIVDKSAFELRTRLIWAGTNDGTADPAGTKANIAAIVASMRSYKKRFVVLGLPGSSGATIGTAGYDYITTINRDLKILYPGNFLDIKAALMRAYNPGNAQDVIDIANGITPSSLRSDTIHLNEAGYLVVAQALKAFLDSKGW